MSTNPSPHLRDLAAPRNFFIGAAVHTGAFSGDESDYRDLLQREFNVLVAENMMKFGELSRTPNTYDWTHSDALVDFAAQHGMKVRGHTWFGTNSFRSGSQARSGPHTTCKPCSSSISKRL